MDIIIDGDFVVVWIFCIHLITVIILLNDLESDLTHHEEAFRFTGCRYLSRKNLVFPSEVLINEYFCLNFSGLVDLSVELDTV